MGQIKYLFKKIRKINQGCGSRFKQSDKGGKNLKITENMLGN